MQGQDTLVLIGAHDSNTTKRTGAGAVIDVPKGGDAKYIGVSAAGLTAQREAITDLNTYANERGTKLMEFDSSTKSSSGEALKVRVAARTTTLTSIARTGAEALKQSLRYAAAWMGLPQADVDKIDVEANTEFADTALAGPEVLAFMQAKQMGLPLSLESIHALMVQNDLTQLTYDDEQAAIADEPPMLGAAAVPIVGPDGQPMTHPVTGKPLTEPAPKRGIAGTNANGKTPKKPIEVGVKKKGTGNASTNPGQGGQ